MDKSNNGYKLPHEMTVFNVYIYENTHFPFKKIKESNVVVGVHV